MENTEQLSNNSLKTTLIILSAVLLMAVATQMDLLPWKSIESDQDYILHLLTQSFQPPQEASSVQSIAYSLYVINWYSFLTITTINLMLLPFINVVASFLYFVKPDWLPLDKSFWKGNIKASIFIIVSHFSVQLVLLSFPVDFSSV